MNFLNLNGILTDCIIDVTEEIEDIKILNIFETLSAKFSDKIFNMLKECDTNENKQK